MNNNIPHWSSDPYWTEALDSYYELRDSGVESITLDIRALEEQLLNGDGPAYKLMNAMCSVKEQEGYDGFRGAPRLVLALIAMLNNQK